MSILPTYGRFDIRIKEAKGLQVIDTEGKEYLDFGAGIGVVNLGHQHPAVKQAVEKQLDAYWHVSNLYHMPIQEEVAELLTAKSVGDFVFFANSGAEANEAAIKLARKVTQKEKIISFKQSFHGRTFATMAATGQDKVKEGFGPMLETFEYATYNDIESVKALVDDNTAAIMLEVIQGEGGVIPADDEFISGLKALADQGILIIIDEIQTGMGRTGKKYGYEHYGIEPDIFTVAKGMGNGLPVAAMITKAKYKDAFGPGSHGSTFGGNPLGMAASKAVLKTLSDQSFLTEVEEKGDYLIEQLTQVFAHNPLVLDVRGKGLMVGIECTKEVTPFVNELIEQGVLTLSAGSHVLRLLPPLVVSYDQIDRVVSKLSDVIK